ncbi:lipid-A-disaccharide synthase-related protein [Oxynema aestuarii]|uniref:Lipid-A-disaccharide synthase n=1 Tax=Oxynema aestuarii AP17 TaxID=2064643 RepID=A0A6H1U1H4_9CYAN|nr:lipid-A-disaccharide synthase-related protein [Oxynema aestuarii]QIZ71873.1 hypothetical protein HCG48_15855 [Oxynema aestuarii AP17]
MKLLCLSNGHGEDAIAVRILRQLQQQDHSLERFVLPLVGEGRAYETLEGVSFIGPVKKMPSGGFIYMDGRQFWGDLRQGLIQLTWAQLQAVRHWAKQGGVILAVGDILPLLMAWASGAEYVFVGTAKSEYYLRDEAGVLPRRTWFEGLESWSGSVYLPWERWLMRHRRCRAVFPRDSLTTETLVKFGIAALDLGNPMMDDLEVDRPAPVFDDRDAERKETERSLVVTLLPGSRVPEAYRNWQQILAAVAGLVEANPRRPQIFLGAIAPDLSLEHLGQELENFGWHKIDDRAPIAVPESLEPLFSRASSALYQQQSATVLLTCEGFVECLREGDLALAMAGTATEQFIGLGKPAIAFPGGGPQFTPAFAEAQSRLLGPSLILLDRPDRAAGAIADLLRDPDTLQAIATNGGRRMGEPGAARRIARHLCQCWQTDRSFPRR